MTDVIDVRERLRARPVDGVLNLAGYDAASSPEAPSKGDAKDQVEGDYAEMLFDAHELVYAEEERSVLLVLQGLDCSGKNGTIKHVVISMNPAGVRVASFKEPTEEEKEHHFLWRYRKELPKPGQLGVFDRSHYEDVLVPLALGTEDEATIETRISEINTFEEELTARGTTILKCLLRTSFDGQRKRFLRRLRRDDKRWKFAESDLETRSHWNEYQAAYSHVVGQTSTDVAPWYIIPSDQKWYRNWAVANLLLATFEDMGAAYPQPDFDLAELRRRLEPPN